MNQEIRELSGVTNKTRVSILNGWGKLAKFMGRNWPTLAQEQRHPWIQDWYNKAPWVKAYYGHIGHQLSLLEGKRYLGAVIDRLKNPDATKCYGAQAEINVAWKLAKSRIPFEFVGPTQSRKSFDFRAKVDRKEIGIEVSVVGQSQKFKIQMEIFQSISTALMSASFQNAQAAGRIHRMLSRTHAKHIIEMINQGIRKALKNNDAVIIEEEGAFEFCIAPSEKVNTLQEWKEKRGYNDTTQLSAPNFDANIGNRLHAKIMQKCKQIPSETAGVVYLEGVPIYIMEKEPKIMMQFKMADVEEAVYENSNLLFVVLNKFSLGWSRTSRFESRGMQLARISHYGLLEDVSMVVMNRYHQFPNLRHKKLINAFLR